MTTLRLAVCGLHLRGQPLNPQLTELNASFVAACRSAPVYKLFAFTDGNGITKPGMVRPLDTTGCTSVYMELWDVPTENFGRFIEKVPAPLGIGTVQLEDGTQVKGFIAEAWVGEAAAAGRSDVADITHLGSWLEYLKTKANA